jgi:hypothetical protein
MNFAISSIGRIDRLSPEKPDGVWIFNEPPGLLVEGPGHIGEHAIVELAQERIGPGCKPFAGCLG